VAEHPTAKDPTELSKDEFRRELLAAHDAKGVCIEETVMYYELHGSGKPHQNCLVRSKRQFRWFGPIEALRQKGIYIDVSKHIKTWADGVVYGSVASDHKPPHWLDQQPQQWARSGTYIPIRELLPQKWQRPGFTRRQRISNMQFLKVCRENEVTSVDEAWALACAMEDKGDHDLMVPA